MKAFMDKVFANYAEYTFWLPEKMDPDSMVILQGYRADQVTPYFIYFKDGLVEEKY